MDPFVSVIIPTYHDWERLKKCLAALKVQTYPHDRFEVLVINNDPQDPVPEMGLPNSFQILSESKLGSYAARNKGISLAKGEILAFTDSDAIPYEDWLEKAVEKLAGGAERIAGRVELFYRSEKLTFAEIYEKAFAFPQEKYAAEGASVTANMVTWGKHFDTVGLFNPSLMSGGDMEWGWRANDLGIPIVFASDVIVRHPARSTIREIIKKRIRVLDGAEKIDKEFRPQEPKKPNPFRMLRGFLPPLGFFFKRKGSKELSKYEIFATFCVIYILKVHANIRLIRNRMDL